MEGTVSVGGESGSMPPTQPMGLLEHVNGRQDLLEKKQQGLLEKKQQDLLEKKQEWISRHHTRHTELHQCGSIMLQQIKVSLGIVWSFVRRFDEPQVYKRFIQTCNIIEGNGEVGSIREIHLVSSVPATYSVERLEILDDENHVVGFRVLGGGHRLQNYSSVTSLHELEIDGRPGTLVLESYVVDIPDGNTKEETHMFVDTFVRCNLKSLAQISEQRYIKECAAQQKLEEKQQLSPWKHLVWAPPFLRFPKVANGLKR